MLGVTVGLFCMPTLCRPSFVGVAREGGGGVGRVWGEGCRDVACLLHLMLVLVVVVDDSWAVSHHRGVWRRRNERSGRRDGDRGLVDLLMLLALVDLLRLLLLLLALEGLLLEVLLDGVERDVLPSSLSLEGGERQPVHKVARGLREDAKSVFLLERGSFVVEKQCLCYRGISCERPSADSVE